MRIFKNNILKLSILILAIGSTEKSYSQVSTFQKLVLADTTSNLFFGTPIVKETNDSGFIVLSELDDLQHSVQRLALVKTDKTGIPVWLKYYDSGFLDPVGVEVTPDSGYMIIARKATILNWSDSRIYILKTNNLGDTLWTKELVDPDMQAYGSDLTPTKLIRLSDGNFLVSCIYYDHILLQSEMVFVKINASGIVLSSRKFYNPINNGSFNAVPALHDEFGMTVGRDIVKFDSIESIEWVTTFHDVFNEDAVQTSDGGFCIVGQATSIAFPFGSTIARTDSSGDTLWTRIFNIGMTSFHHKIVMLEDQSFIVTGISENPNTFYNKFFTYRIDSVGNIMWWNYYSPLDTNYISAAFDVVKTADGGILMAGELTHWFIPPLISGIYLVKINALGNSGCSQQAVSYNRIIDTVMYPPNSYTDSSYTILEQSSACLVSSLNILDTTLCLDITGMNEDISNPEPAIIYPNPFSSSTTILVNPELENQHAMFKLFDVFGSEVKSFSINGARIMFERGNLPSGIYLYKITDNKSVTWCGKVVILDR